ncbi:uncharacterized protein TRUGW13939_08912 [Talaromyces rugulosus]|uniref:ABM domain-containing protein n=1 Tax=Talaromyces rugulosus TaxID=121627 RepID=A0A7H8R6C8_TALRU|nr:uncharacterized protein TRUGW13939_08912 [Talaromyces rugulosus]QKX61756.1 hypothetical protein TRUGW13939_08912 [Talaromyces rugulosus]
MATTSQLPGISLQVTVTIAPENVPKFFELFKPVYEKVIEEPECTFFEVYISPENPGVLSWVENWTQSIEWLFQNQLSKEYYKDANIVAIVCLASVTEHFFIIMSGLRGMVKDGWHPKGKQGGKESWRGDFKGIGQVAGWMGKGKDPNADDQAEHVSRPLTSLKDPSSFGPPPKRNGASAVVSPGATTPTTTTTSSSRSLGAAVPQSSHRAAAAEEEDKPAPPPVPYRANQSGLKTDHLPPPPVRHNTDSVSQPVSSPSARPSLPPRLPARGPAPQSASPPPPPYSETDDNVTQMNQGAVSRLGQAGVSVPGLGIGGTGSDKSATVQTNLNKQVNELHRYGNMSAQEDSQNHVADSKNGTTYGQTQERYQNTDNNSASSASALDSRNMGATANNLRQRGGEQFEAGKKKLIALNQKHKITDRIHSYFEQPPASSGQESAAPAPPPPPHPSNNNANLSRQNSNNIDVEALNKRKPPPPPPPAKKPGLQAKPVGSSTPSPPPLPLGTKPR